MNRLPSEYPFEFVEDVAQQVYKSDYGPQVEQSAIFEGVHFDSIAESNLGIVLTSHCDIQRYSDSSYVLLARLAPVKEVFAYWLITDHDYSEEEALGEMPVAKGKKTRKEVCRIFLNSYLRNRTFRYFFLPELQGILDGSLICFEITTCIRLSRLSDLRKVCVLRSPFREAVAAHYSAYMGRVGTPALKEDVLHGCIESICRIRNS